MPVQPKISSDELRRAHSWETCLNDAMAYLALARQKDDFINSGAYFKYGLSGRGAAQMSVSHAMEKGLVAAAIISAGQVFKNGNVGTHIAGNHTQNLKKLRDLLFVCSDQGNGFEQGYSVKIFKEKVEAYRDVLLSHYDGKMANISLSPTGNLASWRAPNPLFRADAFVDLEKVLYHIHRSLGAFLREQKTELSDQEAEE